QNPIEQEGTYPLPEAQLDRFIFQINIGYPSQNEEAEIIRRTTTNEIAEIEPILDGMALQNAQRLVREMPVADHVIHYALRLVRATRIREEEEKPEIVRDYLSWGAGPRASQNLILAAKARAVLDATTHVTPDHIKAVAAPVLRHRVITNFNAEADGVSADTVIAKLLEVIPVEGSSGIEREQLDSVIR
ncbi:MAG: MoxR family ATPase, partial [Planctomycetota bacterium]